MTYAVKTIYRTIQGEGNRAGRPCVIIRLAGCNLWSGREADRGEQGSCSAWCDTDFRGTDGASGGRLLAHEIAGRAAELWGPERDHRYAVLTGGEPALQADSVLLDAFHRFDFRVAIETNGTVKLPWGLDWITVSPKAGAPLIATTGDELKLVYPQDGLDPSDFLPLGFRHFILQPKDGPDRGANTRAAIDYCLANPPWRLGIQLHKFVGLD